MNDIKNVDGKLKRFWRYFSKHYKWGKSVLIWVLLSSIPMGIMILFLFLPEYTLIDCIIVGIVVFIGVATLQIILVIKDYKEWKHNY